MMQSSTPTPAQPIHPIDQVEALLHGTSAPNVAGATAILRGFLRQCPYAHAWVLYVKAHELASDNNQLLPDGVHNEWLQAVGADSGAARLYMQVAKHLAGQQRIAAVGSLQERLQLLGKAKFVLEYALVTPMDQLEEVLRAYEPIASSVADGLAQQQQANAASAAATQQSAMRAGPTMTPQLSRRYEAAKTIFEYEGAWPERHNSSLSSAQHTRKWSQTLQKLFSTYVCLATTVGISGPPAASALSACVPKPFPSTVQFKLSQLTNEELAHLRTTQKRRIQLAMRQALEQCPGEEILLIHYCAFVAAVTNSTADAKAALDAQLAANGPLGGSGAAMSPAIAALAVALHKIESPSDLFQLLTTAATSTKIAQANNCLDLSIVANMKRFRELGKEATESPNETNRWQMFAEWLEVECNSIGNRTFSSKIAEKGFDKLQTEAAAFGSSEVDALALFAKRAHRMHMAHGTPEEGQLIAEKLVGHLSTLTTELVWTGTSSGGRTQTDTSRLLASAPVNTLREACNLMDVATHAGALRYINGGRTLPAGASALDIALQHGVDLGPCLPLLSKEEAQWASIVNDARDANVRYEDDSGHTIPNEWKHRFHRLTQAMPWGLASADDTVSNEPLVTSGPVEVPVNTTALEVGTEGGVEAEGAVQCFGWKPFVPPENLAMRGVTSFESDEVRAPYAMRGVMARAITIDERTLFRLEREEAYRVAEGRKKSTAYEHLPSLVAKMLKRLPTSADGCTNVANVDPKWLVNFLCGPPLNLGALVEEERNK